MADIQFAEEVFDDFARFRAHLESFDVPAREIERRLRAIARALAVLSESPLLGRPAGRGLRELVIGRGSAGYVVLYRFVPELDVVLVLAARHQRERGYSR